MIWGPMVFIFLIFVFLNRHFAGLIPQCIFHEFTGVPCLTCGATRSVVSLAEFHPLASFLFNPMVPIFLIGLLLLSLLAAVETISGLKLKMEFNGAERRGLRIIIIAAILANWVYLIIAGI